MQANHRPQKLQGRLTIGRTPSPTFKPLMLERALEFFQNSLHRKSRVLLSLSRPY